MLELELLEGKGWGMRGKTGWEWAWEWERIVSMRLNTWIRIDSGGNKLGFGSVAEVFRIWDIKEWVVMIEA